MDEIESLLFREQTCAGFAERIVLLEGLKLGWAHCKGNLIV
jgi:hypothetical protein